MAYWKDRKRYRANRKNSIQTPKGDQMTADQAMLIWSYVGEFDFMDVEKHNGSFKFFGTAKDGSDKIEIIHEDTLRILERDILPYAEL